MTMPHPDTESRPQTPALPTTLEELTRQKAELQRQILAQKATLARLGREMTTPFAPAAEKGTVRVKNRGEGSLEAALITRFQPLEDKLQEVSQGIRLQVT